MHNKKSPSDLVQVDHDLSDFQQRAVDHENHRSLLATAQTTLGETVRRSRTALPQLARRLPRRYMLHILLLLILPVGLIVSRDAARPIAPEAAAVVSTSTQDSYRPQLGLSAESHRSDPAPLNQPVGDPPISDDSMIVPVSKPLAYDVAPEAAPAPAPAPVTINAELANLRRGPSTEFDRIDRLTEGTVVEVIARHENWIQVRTEGGQDGWLALDLLNIDEDVANNLAAPESIPALPPAKVATIAQEDLNLRDGPGTEYISLMKLPVDLEVSLIAKYDGWYQVETPKGTVGWVSQDFLGMREGVAERITVAEKIPSSDPALLGWATDTGVNVRTGPNTKFESLGKLAGGAEVTLLAQYDGWYKVQTARGTVGWMSKDLVDASAFIQRRVPYTDNVPALPKPKPAAKAPAAKAPTTTRTQAVAAAPAAPAGAASGDVAGLAWNYVGSRYVWGGEGPGGFDCSGLTKFLYRQVGVSLPHSARGQYSSAYGSFVSLNNLQPGDLLFYANTAGPGITHVGIYVGGNIMINAMTPASGVGAVNIYSSYWISHYYGALRPYR